MIDEKTGYGINVGDEESRIARIGGEIEDESGRIRFARGEEAGLTEQMLAAVPLRAAAGRDSNVRGRPRV